MKEIGLAIQCNTCQTAGVLGPFGSDMAVSYYKLAVLVTYLFNDVETRRDQRKANAASTRSVLLRGGPVERNQLVPSFSRKSCLHNIWLIPLNPACGAIMTVPTRQGAGKRLLDARHIEQNKAKQ